MTNTPGNNTLSGFLLLIQKTTSSMEFDIISYITSNINIMYIIICNIVTYLVLNMCEMLNNERKMKRIWKRIIAFGIALGIGLAEIFLLKHSIDPIFYGMFIQFITWDYLFKPIMKRIMKKYESDEELNEEVFN